jgi:uncharacterized protein (TIGR03083 family)
MTRSSSGPDREDAAYLIGCLREQGDLLAGFAAAAGLDASVPTCPGWKVTDLLRHLGFVHRWATGYVAEQRSEMISAPDDAELLEQGPVEWELIHWFREGHRELVRTLEQASPEVTCWTFLDSSSPLAFWARRQAHETAIHRADVQLAADPGGIVSPFPARLAADGIDELVMCFGRRKAVRGLRSDPSMVLAIHALDAGHAEPGAGREPGAGGADGEPGAGGADGAAHWRISMEPDRAEVSRGQGPADCDVSGTSSDLYLMLWNRAGLDGLDVTGDASAISAWSHQLRVTW